MAIRLAEITLQDPVAGDEFAVEIIRPDLGDTDRLFYRWEAAPIDSSADQPVLVELATPTANPGEQAGNDLIARLQVAEPNFLNDYEFAGGGNGPGGFTVAIQITHPGWYFDPVPDNPPFATIEYFEGEQGGTASDITVLPELTGQMVSPITKYCYLYEPFRVAIEDANLNSTQMFIELEVLNLEDGSIFETLVNYGVYDINPGNSISVDLMKLVRQHHDANVYNYANIDEIIANDVNGWKSCVSKYKYNFKFTSDETPETVTVSLLPIIGGRLFPDFIPSVDSSQVLTEADLYGVSLANRWLGYQYFNSVLSATPESATEAIPNISTSISNGGEEICGGYLIWKSIFGGWMSWGFDIQTKKFNASYKDSLEVGMFEATKAIFGKPYIPVDYTGVDMSYTLTLKALSLSSNELKAVAGIALSPAIYLVKSIDGELELMRRTSVSAPINSLANGGDFSVTLKSISTQSQKTR